MCVGVCMCSVSKYDYMMFVSVHVGVCIQMLEGSTISVFV